MNTKKQLRLLSEAIVKLQRASNMGGSCRLETDETTVVLQVVNNAVMLLKERANVLEEKQATAVKSKTRRKG